jgi:catechol 2,3-dioxygenase-like lactoylglutathione lyase family enzyme
MRWPTAPAAASPSTLRRSVNDPGNIVAFEHVNTAIPDQQRATAFYITGLGLTRDPYLMTGLDNMWANIGSSQFHLPTGQPQVVRGIIGLVVPELDALVQRLKRVEGTLAGTQFAFDIRDGYVDTISPWGNRIRCHAPDARFGKTLLALAYVELAVPRGASAGIGRFYQQVLGAVVDVASDAAHVLVGARQQLVFREQDAALPEYDGNHIQVYLADLAGPHAALANLGVTIREVDPHQYLFEDVVDPDTGTTLYRLQHEIRGIHHPLYARPLINRNPAQTNRNYVPGNDALQGIAPGSR